MGRAVARFGFPAFDRQNIFAFDPEQPHKSAEEIYQELGGMNDPTQMDHNCPFCKRTMAWTLFKAHAEPCMRKWFKTLDITHRKFAGATPAVSATIKGTPATADVKAPAIGEE